MSVASDDFEQRLVEIKEYLSYLDSLERQPGQSPTLMATMKASTMLMIYNIMESTMTSLIESIFQHMHTSQTGFDALNDSVKVVILKNSRKTEPAKLVQQMRSSGSGLPLASFKRDEVFSGNVDFKRIREILKEFGITLHVGSDGAVLNEVKIARNDLAHGRFSFAEKGKNLSAADLSKKVESVEKILRRVVQTVGDYAANKSYEYCHP
jgi:hypothetical protein